MDFGELGVWVVELWRAQSMELVLMAVVLLMLFCDGRGYGIARDLEGGIELG